MKQAEAKRVPKLHTLNIFDYEKILEIPQSQREHYYKFLFSKEKSKRNDDVIEKKNTHKYVLKLKPFYFRISDKKRD